MTLTELRERADKATPGPWTLGGGGRDVCVRLGPHSGVPRRLWPERSDDARYIAACSPEVIKALVAVAEAAEVRAQTTYGLHVDREGQARLGKEFLDSGLALVDALATLEKALR